MNPLLASGPSAFAIMVLLAVSPGSGQAQDMGFIVQASAPTFVDSGQALGTTDGWGSPALGDLDGDGDSDAFVTNSMHGNRVWLNNGAGIFSPLIQYFGQGFHVSLGDLESDGDLDAFTVNQLSGTFVYVNDGTGGFDSAGISAGSEREISLALGDVDRDRDIDVFIGKIEGHGGNRLHLCTIPHETVRKPSGRVAP